MKKTCQVCGGNAIGFNFNGLSCQSCKIFFRRYAFQPEKFVCSKGNCGIDFKTRNVCQKCRLVKCFNIGMKKELINAKYTKRKDEPTSETIESPNSSAVAPTLINCNSYEMSFFAEVQSAMSVFVDERTLPIEKNATNLLHIFNTHGFYIRRIIRYCKKINAFAELKEADQLILLKEFYCDILTIRASFNYDTEKDGIPFLDNESEDSVTFMPFSLLSQSRIDIAEKAFRTYCTKLKSELDNDDFLKNLLITYRLFHSRNGLSCPEVIRYHQVVYGHLLGRYLEEKYEHSIAEGKHSSLMTLSNDLDALSKLCYEIISNYNSSEVVQVVSEIFNLKNKK